MKHLTQQLAKLSFFTGIKQICAINSGLSSPSFKVQTSQGFFFAKYLNNNDFFVSTINAEVKANEIAAEQGLAPKVCYADKYWLISQYINGTELAKSTLCLNDKLQVAINLMQKCHQLNRQTCVDHLPILSIENTINSLINYDFYQTAQLTLLKQIAQHLVASIQVNANYFCHGDINFSNILITKNTADNEQKQPYLIDFECACLADIEYDLAMLLAINNPEPAYHNAVIHMYEGATVTGISVGINKTLVTRYLSFCYLINALWYFNKFKQTHNENMQRCALKQFTLFDNMKIFAVKLSEKMR